MIKLLSKKSSFCLLIYLFVAHYIFSQNESNKWVIGIGMNYVDYFPTYAPNTGNTAGFLNEFFNIEDHWNISGPQFIINRYLIKRLSLDGLISRNNISKYGDVTIEKKNYIGFDLNLRYNFIDTSKEFTLFLLGGGGYTSAINSGGTINFGGGLNYWFTNVIGINAQGLYKHSSSKHKLAPHFYSAISLVFMLKSRKNFIWRNDQ